MLKALYFVRWRYEGKSIEEAFGLVGVSKYNTYIWQERWSEHGYDGIIPRFAKGKPPSLPKRRSWT
ncbi:MAG: hypothetical protein LLG16_03835 [Euryarchaeota archaeon]|nr:hypothetical protein [Euryarchaeota archaeon]